MTRKPTGPHDESTAKRAANGQFLPGHVPPKSPGRPPGPNGVKARAARLAGEKLEEMLGDACAVVERELEEGNLQVAMWLIDRVRPVRRSDFVQLSAIGGLRSTDDIVEAVRIAVVAVGRGELSISDARSYSELVLRYAALKGLQDIEELKTLLAELNSEDAPLSERRNLDHAPAWFRRPTRPSKAAAP